MSDIQLVMKDIDVVSALEQMDTIRIDMKQRNCLRLLAEEMFSMMSNVLQHQTANFEIEKSGNNFTLTLKATTEVDEQAREAYLSLAKDGKNLAHKGLFGKVVAFAEAFAASGTNYSIIDAPCGTHMEAAGYSYMWALSDYMTQADDKKKELDWDGMEKSIIANFADDVLIGVRNYKIEMIIKKSF